MHPSAVSGKRPPLSPQDGWLSNGRQVLHFRPLHYSRFSQALELTSGELIPGQPPLLKCRKEITREEAVTIWAQKRKEVYWASLLKLLLPHKWKRRLHVPAPQPEKTR